MSPYRFAKWIMEGTPIKLFGDGEQARDFTHVEDIARGTILATKPLGYEIINLGGGNQPVTINEVIGWMEEDLGKKALVDYLPAQSADMKVTWANIERAKSLLGWEPTIAPRDGIRDMTADQTLFRFEISPH
jgi:nucleoside-diphosphate-sugar epimerase